MTKNKKGFTIIEVVLVLAIAGLIFLMVFIALPALQRSQRNTQRDDDLARVLTAVNSYQKNNHGSNPFKDSEASGSGAQGVLNGFVSRYIDSSFDGSSCGNEFKDPQGDCYKIVSKGKVTTPGTEVEPTDTNGTQTKLEEKTFYGYYNATCGAEGIVEPGSGNNDVAVFMKLEGGQISCNDNH